MRKIRPESYMYIFLTDITTWELGIPSVAIRINPTILAGSIRSSLMSSQPYPPLIIWVHGEVETRQGKLGADRLQTHAAAAPDRLIPPGPPVSRGLVPPRNSSAAGLITFGSISFNSPPSRGYYLFFHTAQLHFFHDALLHFFHDALLHFSIPRRSRWPLSGFVVLRSLAC
jgi:hypothetical protein